VRHEHVDLAEEHLERLRVICGGLPDAYEEPAWVGRRWRVRTKTFAHLVAFDGGWPPAYVRAAQTPGPATVLTFESSGEELMALTHAGRPFFKPPWRTSVVGIFVDLATDWSEVAELVTESYLVLAPKRLAAIVRPPD
jgi:hypothetical protein